MQHEIQSAQNVLKGVVYLGTGTVVILLTIIGYLVMMVAVGILSSKKTDDVGDFYLGGRKLGPIVTAMSAEASDMSSYLIMGLPGLAYLCGSAEVSWTIIGLFIGTYLNWLFVAKRLRVYSQKIGAITVPDFFARRYKDEKLIMGISAVIILIFFIPYTGSGFAACGKLFNSLFDVDYHAAMMISAVVIILYTSIGGFLAASFTDLIQSIVMTVSLIVLVCYGISAAGGIDHVIDNANSIPQYMSLTQTINTGTGELSDFGFLSVISTLAWGLGYFGMPHILLRFMAIRDKDKVKTSRRIASVWVIISMVVAMFIGFIGNALSHEGVLDFFTTSDQSERTVIHMADKMSQSGVIMAVFAGLIFSGILACTMSTADSQLLAASSSMSENLLGSVFGLKLSDRKKMLFARLVLVVIAVLAVIIAWDPDSSIFKVVSFAWAGFGATFGPVMLCALFWKRSNKYGAIAGMVSGGVVVFVWHFIISKLGGPFAIYELLPAFVVAQAVMVCVSLATKAPDKEITDEFDEVAGSVNKS
ncbi:MAG: sodium/proline symporter [Ruminococcus sp.]|nr:sodium/proline symporter [Ruminococcus sp.]